VISDRNKPVAAETDPLAVNDFTLRVNSNASADVILDCLSCWRWDSTRAFEFCELDWLLLAWQRLETWGAPALVLRFGCVQRLLHTFGV